MPRINCKEVALLLAHFTFLIGRTWLSLVVARLDGAIVRDLVAANGKGFAKGLIYWFLIAIPASYNNAMVSLSLHRFDRRFVISKLNYQSPFALV